ncbi:MAG: M48 family peptidase, partial [Rothia mucilaginosa]
MAQRFKREILPATEDRPQIELVRSARRTRTISMQRDGEDAHGNPAYRLLIPAASTSEEIDEHIARLLPRIQRRAARRERATQLTVTDEYLRSRALHLAQKHLPELVASGRLEKLSIRWVSNQRQRWGSATYANTQ